MSGEVKANPHLCLPDSAAFSLSTEYVVGIVLITSLVNPKAFGPYEYNYALYTISTETDVCKVKWPVQGH